MFFLFDENVPYRFVEGLRSLEEANRKTKNPATVSHPRFLDKEGASDKEQIQIAGKNKAIIVTFDKDFKHLKSYKPLYREHKVGVVFLKLGKDDSTYWGIVKLIINRWEELKAPLKDKKKPFAYQLDKKGIQRFEL